MENLVIKFLTDSITDEELKSLTDWLHKSKKNQERFKAFVRANRQMDMACTPIDVEIAYKKILERTQNKRVLFKKRYQTIFKYAAIAILFLGISYFYQQGFFSSSTDDEPIIVNKLIETGTDKATLTLENGEEIALEKGTSFQTQNANSDGEQIVYEAMERNPTEIVYNYLTIPRGGQFSIKLSDGTQVWLNSESRLKYPVLFKAGEARQVELIYGEAYFEVSPSTEHRGAKFKVFNLSQEIEVLGTEFNIKAYKDETSIYTTLVEGKVTVSFDGDEKQNLIPSQQSKWNPNTKQFSVDTVNVYNEISWKYGIFSFDKKPLKEIVKTLSRWYDVDIIILDKTIEETEFVGVLRKNKNLEDIILNIKNFGIIQDYKINGKTVILK